MALEDLKIRAMDGSALVDGRIAISGGATLAAAFPGAKPGDIIGVELSHNRLHRSAIRLYRSWHRAHDGLYAAGQPIISVEFGEAMPDLRRLASSGFGELVQRWSLRSHDTRPGTQLLTIRFAPAGREDALPVYAHLEDVAIELTRRETGLVIRIEGPLLPFSLEKGGPMLEEVRLDCEVVLPPDYCRLSTIGSYYGGWDREGEWCAGGEGLGSIPISAAALGPGLVDWQQNPARHLCNGPFVQAYLGEDGLTVRPARRIWRNADGMCHAELDTDGPELRLGLGRSMLASLLAHSDRASVSFQAGIGQVDGQTGRSVGECGGPMTQAIRWLDIKLERNPHELHIEGKGELEPLAPSLASVVASLGPRLRFTFALQRTWLLARGIELPRFYDDWRREFGSAAVW
jgi:hypothetical protein